MSAFVAKQMKKVRFILVISLREDRNNSIKLRVLLLTWICMNTLSISHNIVREFHGHLSPLLSTSVAYSGTCEEQNCPITRYFLYVPPLCLRNFIMYSIAVTITAYANFCIDNQQGLQYTVRITFSSKPFLLPTFISQVKTLL